MIPLTVSRFPMAKADSPDGIAYGVHDHTTWGEFATSFLRRREGDKDGDCFAAATFVLEPDGQRVRRLKANVTARTVIPLDIETNKKTGEIPPPIGEVVDHLARWGRAAVVYTSHNHKPDVDERYRVILPISEPIDPRLPAVEVAADHLGLLGVLDISKIGAASLFYFPSTDPGRLDGHEAYILPGAPLDAARLSAAAANLQAERDAEAERIAAEAHAAAAARRAERLAAGFDPDDSLIEKLRAHYDLADVLRQHGYDQAGKKYRHPNSSSGQYGADIKVLGGVERVFSHNATDLLHADNLPAWCGTVNRACPPRLSPNALRGGYGPVDHHPRSRRGGPAMTRRRDFLGIAAGVLAAGTVSTGTNAEGPQLASVTRDAAGRWPRDIFPPGQHPALDYHGPSIPDEPGDAVLLDLIARFNALEHRINARFDDDGPLHIEDQAERDAANEPLQAQQEALLGRICATRAVTHEGTAAKAQMLHLWAADVVEGLDSPDWIEQMVAGIVLDLLALPDAG